MWWICDIQPGSARNAFEAWVAVVEPAGFQRTSMVVMVVGDVRVLLELARTCKMYAAFARMGCLRCNIMHRDYFRVARALRPIVYWEHAGRFRERSSRCWPCHRLAVQGHTSHGRRYCPTCDVWAIIGSYDSHNVRDCSYRTAWANFGWSAPLSAGLLG